MQQQEKHLTTIIISSLIIQFLCRYYSQYFSLNNSFQLLIFILRFCVPFLIITFYLKISWKDLGISIPQMSYKGWLYLAGVFIAIPVCLYAVELNNSYQSYYKHLQSGRAYIRFAIFTISTLPAWEFLHRSYLLFGIKYILDNKDSSQQHSSAAISLLVVMVFETLYHFIKPDMEACAMMIASPVFSLIALRTRSILIPLLIHLYIELWFILYMAT